MRKSSQRLLCCYTAAICSVIVATCRHGFAAEPATGSQPTSAVKIPLLNPGFELGAVGSLPESWTVPQLPGYTTTISADDPFAGDHCATIRCQGETATGLGNLVQRIDATPYRGQRLRFRAAVRASSGKARLWFRVDRKTAEGAPAMGAFDNMGNRPITSPEWKHYEIVADVGEDADRLSVGMMFTGTGQAWIDDASLEVVGREVAVTTPSPAGQGGSNAPQTEAKPGLFEVMGDMVIAPAADTAEQLAGGDPNRKLPAQDVLIPLPLAYCDQSPLSYELKVTPPSSVSSLSIDRDGPHNTVLKVKLAAGRRGSVKITFRSVLLIGPSDFRSVPKSAPFPETWPADVSPWLAATWCANSNHERIRALANEIRTGTNTNTNSNTTADTIDVLETIRRVQKTTGTVFRLAQGRGELLTAVDALDKHGSCTSCANLVAAFLRACGVPARIVAGYPSWSGPLQTHYIVEAYVPDYGWYPIESTMGQSPWPNFQQANVAIIPPEHEKKSCAGPRVGVAPGVPYLSLTELPGNDGSCIAVGALPNATGCDHVCRALTTLEGTAAQWTQAAAATRSKWNAWISAAHKLDAEGRLTFGDPSMTSAATSIMDLLKPDD